MLLALWLALGCGTSSGLAQDLPAVGAEDAFVAAQERQRRLRTFGLIAAGTTGVLSYGKNHWWKDGFDSNFKTVDEGWFGQNTYSGGADKLGHAYYTYLSGRLLARAFEWAGNAPDAARRLGVWSALGTLMAVEVLDGYSRRWRFSREDAIMNFAGAGLAYLLEGEPALDRLLDLRLQYRPSRDARRLDQADPIGDHSGQTYLLVVKASGVPQLRDHPLLRYLELAVGYGARGYEPKAGGETSRHVYVGVSLNLSELLRQSAYRGHTERSLSQRVTETAFEFFQVPGTAALVDHRLGR